MNKVINILSETKALSRFKDGEKPTYKREPANRFMEEKRKLMFNDNEVFFLLDHAIYKIIEDEGEEDFVPARCSITNATKNVICREIVFVPKRLIGTRTPVIYTVEIAGVVSRVEKVICVARYYEGSSATQMSAHADRGVTAKGKAVRPRTKWQELNA